MTRRHEKEGYNMIDKFYTIDNGLDEVNCFSSYEVFGRMTVLKVPDYTVQNLMPYVQSMKPNDYIVVGGENFGRLEVRCWG